jgi:hypothetical protein
MDEQPPLTQEELKRLRIISTEYDNWTFIGRLGARLAIGGVAFIATIIGIMVGLKELFEKVGLHQ